MVGQLHLHQKKNIREKGINDPGKLGERKGVLSWHGTCNQTL
jgi:hypothetical protein